MAPSAIVLAKMPRKRRSFEGIDVPPKTHCLSDNEYSDDDSSSPKSLSPHMDDDRRAHHNELERRRRDHIKDHFMALKDAVPLLDGEKSSRALILKRAVEYISLMQKQIAQNDSDIVHLRQQNRELESQMHSIAPCRRATPPFSSDEEMTRPSVSGLPYSLNPCRVTPSVSGPLPVPAALLSPSSHLNNMPNRTLNMPNRGLNLPNRTLNLPNRTLNLPNRTLNLPNSPLNTLNMPNLTAITHHQPSTVISAFSLPSELSAPPPNLTPTINAVARPTVDSQPSVDAIRESILRAVSSNPLLNISSLLLANSPLKLNQSLSDFEYPSSMQSRLLVNSLTLRDQQLAAATTVRF